VMEIYRLGLFRTWFVSSLWTYVWMPHCDGKLIHCDGKFRRYEIMFGC
jgi:hypothetical protein